MQYDRAGDAHYDSISALIKSIRGSDPDAALYWLARMLEGGEDVRFLARRLVILASEDVGNADPAALPLAVATAQACELVGLPECQLNLAQAVIYLACAPKSNSATVAIGEARRDVPRRPSVARAGAPARLAAMRGRSGWGTARATNTRTTKPTRSPRRIIWGSSASITGRRTAASRRSWRSGWRRFARLREGKRTEGGGDHR